jgi:signal transduction histidine kinase
MENNIQGKEAASAYEKLEQAVKERTAELDETAKVLVRRDLELTESNERLRDLDQIKSQFVSVAAHQLRTPLAGIRWTLYALLEEQVGKLNADQKKFAGDAYQATTRLIDLVNDLLDVSRLEEGRFGFKIKRAAFVPIVTSVYEGFQSMAKNKGIDLSLTLPEKELPLLDIDEEKVGIALENFIENAIKYTVPPGSVSVKVIEESDQVSVEVSDTGIGIPKDQVPRVFEKFFRGENAQLFQTSGTGLGLYVSKNIVEHHGGAVYFKTEENKGSVFTFSLPIPKT